MHQTPLLLDVNTKVTKLREVIDKIIKGKLGMNLPLVMVGSTLVFEDGDGLDEDEAANYALNLEKVLCSRQGPREQCTHVICSLFSLWPLVPYCRIQYIYCQLNVDQLLPVLAEPSAPVINGTKLTVEDFQQELSCSINIKHMLISVFSLY
jgi:ubiquitin-like 1-activating enzyme E1 B